MLDFLRVKRLPPYVFDLIEQTKKKILAEGGKIIDFGMGNPDQATPSPIVERLIAEVREPKNHRYAISVGILPLRQAMASWYQQRFDVTLDPETEIISTIGSKEGLAQLALATVEQGDCIIAPEPCYPIHRYGFIIAGAEVLTLPLHPLETFCERVGQLIEQSTPKPKILIVNFPGNPTADCVELPFYHDIVAIAKKYDIFIVNDLAYAELGFDGYQAPSIFQVPDAINYAVESYSMSKTYNMPGWRVGFISGNRKVIAAIARLKSYMDYGSFAPIQYAAVEALLGSHLYVDQICEMYQHRRNVLCESLENIGWSVTKPKATMFVWAKIPEKFSHLGSRAFAQLLLEKAHVFVSPGIGFGESADGYVRFALVEDEENTRTGVEAIGQALQLC
jgi:alanine-synthesizing transaminase